MIEDLLSPDARSLMLLAIPVVTGVIQMLKDNVLSIIPRKFLWIVNGALTAGIVLLLGFQTGAALGFLDYVLTVGAIMLSNIGLHRIGERVKESREVG